jgi:uncharacterized secreted protein with C-terminal beta-propeller domain
MYDIYLPRVESNTLDMTPKVHYFDRKEDNYVFNTITSISLKTKDVVDSKSFMLGYSTNLMVSENNIYLSYENQNWYYRRCYSYYCDEENDKERFYDVILPLLEGELKSDVQNIIQSESDEDKRWKQIAEVFGDFFKRAENDVDMQKKYDEMMVNIEDSLDEYDFKKEMENKKTFIHRIAIDNGLIEHKAKGEVYGSLLNQFSLDEDDGFLRVATTLSMWSGKRIQFSNVYVLNEDLKVVGEVKNIAPDERIYSTRFLGDKLYMVTFKQIDPFFVIDLKDPKNPEILGELKIPGFSTYLHPYDENTIIGIGKQTKENEWGGVDESALKISLFDVSDFSNPKEIDTYEIGET